jgi:hypothetical protein
VVRFALGTKRYSCTANCFLVRLPLQRNDFFGLRQTDAIEQHAIAMPLLNRSCHLLNFFGPQTVPRRDLR